MLKFFGRWIETPFRHSIGTADFISGIIAAVGAVFAHYSPQATQIWNQWGRQIPVWVLFGIVLARLLLAPYWMWKEDQALATKAQDDLTKVRTELELKLSPQLVAKADQYTESNYNEVFCVTIQLVIFSHGASTKLHSWSVTLVRESGGRVAGKGYSFAEHTNAFSKRDFSVLR